MGVEYEHYLIPDEPLRRPSAERVARLVHAMEAEGFLLSPKSETFRKMAAGPNFARRGSSNWAARKSGASYDDATSNRTPAPGAIDAAWLRAHKQALRICFPFEQVFENGVRFPLTRPPYVREWVYFTYEIRWSRYVMELAAENVGTSSLRCVCGTESSQRSLGEFFLGPFFLVHETKCSACGATLDPKSASTRVVDMETGHRRSIPGGALYRFALVVDCGKNIPEAGAEPKIDPELVALVERVIGCRFHEIGAVC